LLLVGLLIAGVMIWIVIRGNRLVELGEVSPMETGVAWFDMVTSGSITLAVLFLGQAIVRYEVFTGKTLPQRRFMRHWRNVVALAISCGVVMSAALLGSVHPVYILLVMAILVTVSYALFSRNSYAERERYINHLRPFIVSQRLYDHLLAATSPADLDLNLPFQALCRDVLGTRIAYLAGVGSLGPLMGTPAVYPEQMPVPILPLAELCRQFRSTQIICIPVDPATCGEAHWAVPLWSERGLIGILLLGEKWNGGLYTQEEIEIARASGERMIDTKASTELAQRLMTLQRQRLTESQVVDRRTRRTLHDEILPKLHATMLALNGDKSTASQDSVHMLANLHGEIANLLHAMPDGLALDLGSTSLVGALKQLLDGELSHEFEEVTWQVDLAAEGEIRKLPLLTLEVLYFAAREAIRNAARHGRGAQEDRSLKLTLTICCQSKLEIVVEDNGVGLDRAPGGKTSGNGLALHSTMMAIAGGLLAVENLAGHGTRVVLSLTHA
ncbi:MAG TPA: hypothetical protein VKQ72_01370, partial [Aggregatilineales bacterium]|nr:hypothetical protein [Aggregatilineales bacterium]